MEQQLKMNNETRGLVNKAVSPKRDNLVTKLKQYIPPFIAKYVCILLFVIPGVTYAISPDENMNSELMPIYEALVGSENERIINKEFTVTLVLKHASDRHIIFSDAYVKVSENEKYQIAKWEFSPEITKKISGKSGIKCKVTFVVSKINVGVPYKNIPHIVAKIMGIQA